MCPNTFVQDCRWNVEHQAVASCSVHWRLITRAVNFRIKGGCSSCIHDLITAPEHVCSLKIQYAQFVTTLLFHHYRHKADVCYESSSDFRGLETNGPDPFTFPAGPLITCTALPTLFQWNGWIWNSELDQISRILSFAGFQGFKIQFRTSPKEHKRHFRIYNLDLDSTKGMKPTSSVPFSQNTQNTALFELTRRLLQGKRQMAVFFISKRSGL